MKAVSNANAHALCEEDLPVLRRNGRHEDAQRMYEAAGDEDIVEQSRVQGTARNGADGKEQEELQGTDPGDVGWRTV